MIPSLGPGIKTGNLLPIQKVDIAACSCEWILLSFSLKTTALKHCLSTTRGETLTSEQIKGEQKSNQK